MTRLHPRPLALLALLVAGLLTLATAPAWAAAEARISDVDVASDTITFVLSAEGLTDGESIDPASVRVEVDSTAAESSAKPIGEAPEPTQRTVLLALDVSGSMAEDDRLPQAQAAALAYLDGLPADVEAGLVTFADTARVRVAPTTDRTKVAAAIGDLEAKGGTALYDAVELAVTTLGEEGSRAIVLLSDGKDEGSSTSAKDAVSTVRESGVVLDAVSFGTGAQEAQLAALARAGNGSTVTATDAAGLVAAFESAARTVGSQLLVEVGIPAGIPPGTSQLSVTATVGDQTIADSAAALIPEVPDDDEGAHGPVAVGDGRPGLLSSRWFLLIPLSLIGVALATLAAIALGALDDQHRRRGRIGRRLAAVEVTGARPESAHDPVAGTPLTVLGEGATIRRAVSWADWVTSRVDVGTLTRRLEAANVALRPGEWVVVHLLIATLAGLLTFLLDGFRLPLALVALLLGLLLPWGYLSVRAERRRRAFYEALPDSMQMLAGALSAGYALPQALDNVAREAGGSMSEELNRALLESRLGTPLDEALEAAAARMHSTDFHWVVMAMRINRRVGGNLAEVLGRVARTIRERERLRRQVKSLSAEGRLSAWILALMPVVVGVFVMITRPDYLLPLFTTTLGWLLVGGGLLLYVIGLVWLRNLVRMEV